MTGQSRVDLVRLTGSWVHHSAVVSPSLGARRASVRAAYALLMSRRVARPQHDLRLSTGRRPCKVGCNCAVGRVSGVTWRTILNKTGWSSIVFTGRSVNCLRGSSRTYDNPLVDVTDLVGVRVICYYIEDLRVVADIIEREFDIDRENSVDLATRDDPSRFGYTSIHFCRAASTSSGNVGRVAGVRVNASRDTTQNCAAARLGGRGSQVELQIGTESPRSPQKAIVPTECALRVGRRRILWLAL